MARRRKNGRFTKSTRRRRSKPKTNLTNLAVSALVANSISQNVAGIGMIDFLTAGTSFSSRGASGWATRGDQFNNIITLQEILSGEQRQSSGSGQPIGDAVMQNLKANWLPLTVGIVGIPVAVRVVSKLIRKPVILPANRMLKSVGLDVKI
jgi:hypothetical protein